MKKTVKTKKIRDVRRPARRRTSRVNLGKYIISLAVFALVISGFYWFFNRDDRDPKVLGVAEEMIKMDVPEWYLDPLVVSQGNNFLSITPLAGKKVQVENAGEKHIYRDAYLNTDVAHTEYSFKIKEEMIFKRPGHPIKFQYRIGNIDKYYVEKDKGNLIFYNKESYGEQPGAKELSRVFTIPAPFVEDSRHYRRFDVLDMEVEGDLLIISVREDYFKDAKYPITLDPTVEINILNLYSHPQQGDNWEVEFTTKGQADLKIIPEDQATIADDEFTSLACDGEEKIPEILTGDIIYYKNWQCAGTGKVIHRTLKADKHTLRFEFGDPANPDDLITVWAYNSGESWYNANWGYRIKITVANTEVDADLTDFPIYVNLDDLPDDTFWAHVKTACADVRITKADGLVELPREIVACDTSAKTGEMHFQADALANSTDTDFYIYYGNASAAEPAADSDYGSQAVWDDGGSGYYQGVWHLPNGTSLTANDSTSNAKNGTITGSAAIAGQMDGGANFPNSTDRITISSISLASGVYTISTWFKTPFPTTNYTTLTRGNNDHQVLTQVTTRLLGAYDNAGGTNFHSSGFDVSTLSNGWHYLTAETSGTNTVFYIDGGSVGTADWRSTADIISLGNYQGGGQQWGYTDELRISTGIARATGWITTEYNNQSSPATFYNLTAEEASGIEPPPATESPLGYRKSHTINAAAGAGTDYQVKITAYYGSGTDSAGNVYLSGHGRTDFADVRFYASDGTTALDYWTQLITDSESAIFWVKVAADLSTVSQNIYIYYGNESNTTTTSNGPNTFLFFDDFSGSAVDATKWDEVNTGAGTVNVSGGSVTINSGGDWWGTADTSRYLVSKSSMGTSYATEAYVKQDGTLDGYNRFYGVRSGSATNAKTFVLLGDGNHSHITNVYRDTAGGSANWYGEDSGVADPGVNKIARFEVIGDTVNAYYNNSLANARTVSGWDLGYIGLTDTNNASYGAEFDWVFARKFIATEPAHGAWGEEEALSVPTPPNPQGVSVQADTVFKANMIFKAGEPVE
ncbi:MAG: DUF2341 domain-containing protein [Patescibacteria group bacterium]|jgi:hypothetical protein